ncbi:FAD-dependent oxidoreductase [Spongorhabdus nitratireducens]
MSDCFDIAIIGAGPAGMSAAITASAGGASVIVLDEKARAGGQIYRNVTASPLPSPEVLGPDYMKGRQLIEAFDNCAAEKLYQASVWHVGDNGEILFSYNNETRRLAAKEIIVTCGAMERPFPIPGWHLPGVMSAGSAQVMLKAEGIVRDDAIFVGTGPLLYQIVAQYIDLGVPVRALIDTTPWSSYASSARYTLDAATKPGMVVKGLGLLGKIAKAGIPVYRAATGLAIAGEGKATSIRFESGGKNYQLKADHFFLHQGVIPNLNMSRALGLELEWSEQQLCWKPKLDTWGQSSVPSVAVAGDGSGIVGADGAAAMGDIVALNKLFRLEKISEQERNQRATPSQRTLDSLNSFRRFIDHLYRPIDECRIPQQEDTVVCRCEERTLADLKQGFELGGKGPNDLKGMTRCGMGPCQGRQCGHTVSELLAQWRNQPVADVGYYRLRSPMKLLSLTEMSAFSEITPRPVYEDAMADKEAV